MKVFYYILMIFFISFNLNAQLENGETNEKVIKKELVKMLTGPSNIGTDFWVSVPPPYLVADPQSYTRFFIASGTDCTVRISSESGIDISKFVKAGSTESFDLKPGECQPYVWQVGSRANPAQVYVGKGLNITSTAPVIVYVVIRYRYTSDGYLALPTQGLGTEYISSVYDSRPYNGNSLPNMLTIVAPYDRTKVDFYLGGNIETEVEILGGQRMKPGDTKRWTMNKGDVLVLSNYGDFQTLSGSYIKGDKPIAVISGQACTDVPVNTYACDYTVEMDIPIHSWGQIYNLPWVRVRQKPSVMRIFAKDPQTTVWRDGQQVAYFTDGCYLKGGGFQNAWLEQRIWPVGIDPNVACYTSDKPMYISIYNPGETDDGVSSDPFSIVVTPIEQYQNEIIFCTPASGGGRNFSTNFCNVVIELDENNLIPADLEFGRVNGDGTVDWEKVITKFGANVAPYYSPGTAGDATALENSPHKGRKFGEKNILLPGDGVYAIRSNSLFAAYSYGFDSFDSYGFPTSTALRVISKDTVAPEINWTIDCIGNVEGTTTDLPDDETIRVGLSIPELQWDEIINFTDFTYDNNNFIPGTETTAWRISVEDPTKYAKVIVVFYDRSGNVSRDTIEYYPELLDLREVAADDDNGDLYDHNHGVVGLSESHTMRYEIENLSDSRTFSLTELKLKFKDQNFTIEPLGWNLTDPFAPKEIRQFDVSFITDEEGRFLDSIGLATECNDKFFTVIKAETGIPGITVDDYNFPVQVLDPDGNNTPVQSAQLRISNVCEGVDGTQPLVIIGYNDPANPEFTHDLNNLTFPLTIQPGEQVNFRVTFTPTTVGDLTDEIVFITEQGELGCDPVCKLTAKVTEAGILAQEHDWGKVRIDYSKQANTYAPTGSELITVRNTATGPDAANLKISNIIFESVDGPIGNPFEAFSFRQDFTTSLPTNNNNYFRNVNLAPGGVNPQRMIYFRPQTVGRYEINYYFESTGETSGSETKYSIIGHGIVPNMIFYHDDAGTEVTDNVDYGTITAGVTSESVTKSFFIENRPDNTDDGDILTITDINWGPNVSATLANAGGLPFAVDEQTILDAYGTSGNYPISLGIGQQIQFDIVYYTEEANVPHTAVITIDSDADETGNTGSFNGNIILNGNAVRPSLNLETEPIYSCISNPLVIDEFYTGYENLFYAVNEGTKDVTVNRMYFEPSDGNNTGYTINVDGGRIFNGDGSQAGDVNSSNNSLENIVLSPDQKLVVFLTYTPTSKYDINPKMIRMVADTDIENADDQPSPSEFGCTSNNFVRATNSIVMKDDGTNFNPINEQINYNVDSHRNLDYVVSLENTPDIADAGLSSLEIEVEYRRSYMTYDNLLGVELLGNYTNGFEIVNLSTSLRFEQNPTRNNKYDVIEKISFTVNALGNNIINGGGDFFVVHFNTGIPNIPVEGYTDGNMTVSTSDIYLEGRDQGPTETFINTSMTDPSGSSCASITVPGQITLDLDPVCGMGLRPLSTSNFNNQAGLIAPNPVGNAGANIEFSIAFDSETVVRIVDTKGDVVAVLNNSKLKAGEYSFPIPVDKLSNGVYMYEIESFGLNVNDKFIVNK